MRQFFFALTIVLPALLFAQTKGPQEQKNKIFPFNNILLKGAGLAWNFDTLVTFDTTDQRMDRMIQTFDAAGNTLSRSQERWHVKSWVRENISYFTYDTKGNLLAALTEGINEADVATKFTYTYDEKGNRTSDLLQTRVGNALLETERTFYVYNAKGNLLGFTDEKFDNKAWALETEYKYEYDSEGRTLSEEYRGWVKGILSRGGKRTFTYDKKGNVLTMLGENLKDSLWEKNHQITYAYDVRNKEISYLHETWNRKAWKNNERKNSTYDFKGNLLSYSLENWVGNAWVMSQKILLKYDSLGNQISHITENPVNRSIINKTRYSFVYDSKGNILKEVAEYWGNNAWLMREKKTLTYDARNNILTRVTERTGPNNLPVISKLTYSYNEGDGTTSGKMELYRDGSYLPSQIPYNYGIKFYYNKKTFESIRSCYRFKASFVKIK